MTGGLVFRRIELPVETAPLALEDDIIKASVLVDAMRMRKSEQRLRRRASDVLRSARRRAATIRAVAEQAANQQVEMACAEQAQGIEALADTLADAMGDLVQAVLEEMLLEDAEERARLCAALAQGTLQRELGAVVRGHPEDMATLTALSSMQPRPCESDTTVPRGTLLLRTGHGHVRVDPASLLQSLCADLKRHLAASRDSRRAASSSTHPSDSANHAD